MRIRCLKSSPERERAMGGREAESGVLGGGATSQTVQATLDDGKSEEANSPLRPAEGR